MSALHQHAPAPAATLPTTADGSDGQQKRNLWTSMLESVASAKKLPEKTLVVLGGTPDSQRDFINSLCGPGDRRNLGWQRIPPLANQFALGYSYYDVLDTDQDDTLARVSLHLLSQPSAEFASLISSLLTPEAVPHTALVILLDWLQPHLWLRQLWNWIQVFEQVLAQVAPEARQEMENLMSSWRERGRGGSTVNLDGTALTTASSADGDGLLPLGPGEWSEPLGLPLCVVCQNAQNIDFLEKSKGWKEADFDTVLQYLRTVLLRHGASLIYTSQNSPTQLPLLIQSTLGITSPLQRQSLKHNVIDRDKVMVAPNWDSWGKIRILGGSFDAEAVSKGWEEDIQLPLGSQLSPTDDQAQEAKESGGLPAGDEKSSAVLQYESWCRDPNSGGLAVVESAMRDDSVVGVESEDPQEFLQRQVKILEAFKSKVTEQASDEMVQTASRKLELAGEKSVKDHIGPVQFNMGGIQVDADDMLQRLKDRNAHAASTDADETEKAAGSMTKEYDNEQLQSFFSGLMNRTAGAADSTRP